MNTRMNENDIRDKYIKNELTTYALNSLLKFFNFFSIPRNSFLI
jgi:hypothetical protein